MPNSFRHLYAFDNEILKQVQDDLMLLSNDF
jgi:hypothetical protein